MDGIGSLTQGSEVGEYLSIAPDPDAIQITDTPDGGAFIDMGGAGERDESEPPDPEFYGNLAAILPKVVSQRIVTELMRKIEEDRESRKKRDEIYEEGIRRTGLGKEAPGGAQFEGASRAVHPGMIEACIDYESRMIKELAPPTGPVKPRILGEATPEKTERAKRKTEHMNWQFRTQIKEARDVLEATLMQVPLGGSQFVHQYLGPPPGAAAVGIPVDRQNELADQCRELRLGAAADLLRQDERDRVPPACRERDV